jgi:subtilisin family serine protease
MNLSHKGRIATGGLAALVLLAAGALLLPAADAATATRTTSSPAAVQQNGVQAGHPYTVTLITGDRVTVGSARPTTGSVQPGPGRAHMSFALSSAGGHLRVIPADAASLIRSDQVDQRLFDVTGLISLGYDDADRPTVPLIMQSGTGSAATAMGNAVTAGGARKTRDLKAVHGAAITAPKRHIGSLWTAITSHKGGMRHVWLDGKLQPSLDQSVPQIGAPAAWHAGYQGEGMRVAVLDGGVDATHPDLAGRVTSANFTSEDDVDLVGHGTHVASTIAGNGAASGGKYKGVAPKASILSGKVCEVRGCPESSVLAGMQWAAADQHARVISMSLGGQDFSGTDPLEDAVNTLTAQTGALFVIAAGNAGDTQGTVSTPGNADSALTVGAVDKSDVLAPFSSRGPRTGDEAVKPDITAPGVNIVAARAAGTELGTPAADFPDSYVALDGTSMATPHVAGSAALLAQEHPDWKAAQLKDILMSSAAPKGAADAFQQGAGRVDVAHAITQTITTEPASVSFGLEKWPHDSDRPLTKTVTYHNAGTSALTLDLSLPGDKAGVYSLSTGALTVPAGGTADVKVTADTRGDVPFGTHTAELTATNGSTSAVTPIGVDKESERYELTLKHINLGGQPATNYLTQIFQPDGGDYFDLPYDPSGTVTLRVPPGRYSLGTYLDPSATGDGAHSVVIFQPVIDIAGNTSVTFDAREATPVSQSVPDQTARAVTGGIMATTVVNGKPILFGFSSPGDFTDKRIARLGGPVVGETSFTGAVFSAWVKENSGEAGYDSPYSYQLSEVLPGATLLSGYHKAFAAAELASVKQVTHSDAAGVRAYQWLDSVTAAGDFIGEGEVQMHAPGTGTTYFSTAAGVRWVPTTAIGLRREIGGIVGTYYTGEARAYQPGQQSQEDWGSAPYGTQLGSDSSYFRRDGAEMLATIPPVGDAAGHPGQDPFTRKVTTSLYRGDTLLDQEDGMTVGADGLPDPATTYTVKQSSSVDTGELATRIDVAMTYPSSSTQDKIPVIAVNAAPKLGPHSTAAAGSTGTIPLSVLDQAGKRVPAAELTAQVSYDDGATWQNAPIKAGCAQVSYPAGSGFVSLRLHASDASGRSFDQTVIRAYRFG